MKSKVVVLILGLVTMQLLGARSGDNHTEPEWTWLHQKIFAEHELQENSQKQEIRFTKVNLVPFSQLVFSWNAHRPEKGYFSFLVQVRHSDTGTWGKWHRMIDWGADIQCSYASKQRCFSEYIHVRLEVPGSKANGFRIKIVACDTVDLSLMRSFAVCLSDFSRFAPETGIRSYKKLPSVHIPGVPKQSQLVLDHHRKEGLCSPTSCSMLVGYLTDTKIEPTDFAQKSFDNGLKVYGSWPFNMAHAFERADGKIYFSTARSPSFKFLYRMLQKGIPVAVSVRGPLEGASGAYANGHLMVVTGWDKTRQEVICHDPAFSHDDAVEKRYPLRSFLRAWERSHRLMYLAEPLVKRG